MKFMKFLRFMNMLEPNKNILSISKIFMWISMIAFILVLIGYIIHPDIDPSALIAAIVSVFTATSNYAFRRFYSESSSKTKSFSNDHLKE